jgi:uncharacterized protein YcfJ
VRKLRTVWDRTAKSNDIDCLLRVFHPSAANYICSRIKPLRTSMSTPNSDQRNEETSRSSENIEIPPIPKTTAGAVAGAAVGSIAGPIGAVVGGVAGAVAGRASRGPRVRQASARTLRTVASKAKSAAGSAKRQLTTRSRSRSRKKTTPSRNAVKRRASSRSKPKKSGSKARAKRASSSSRTSKKRGSTRKKRH